ncbi:uncharacterized protein C8A04DRAFT_29932 [Dichotomopilus funicola]|uniref:Uncharacterized protein n=1 Tax=Dichotomopilus funicola TaxID=1934379 RepID=A0AAN6V0E4_9PEZI|nr:hypothetical protein C8A04DRAFT_29932 [Dichotomopilus funicola]
MHDNRTHPLLQQLPLTVSPFVNLPTATTLPYRYKPMPSTLPPSAAGITASTTDEPNPNDPTQPVQREQTHKPKYVISPSGHAAHPDEILASCRALHAHVAQLRAQAEADLDALTERIRARELAEKRRVAPGWLDSEARLLEPERAGGAGSGSVGLGGGSGSAEEGVGGVEMGSGLGGLVFGGEFGGGFGGGDFGGQRQGEMLLQQPVAGFPGSGIGQGGHGPGGVSEMAVPDEGEELDRAFGSLRVDK